MTKHLSSNRPAAKSQASPRGMRAASAASVPTTGRRRVREAARLRMATRTARPAVAYRQRGHIGIEQQSDFYAQEQWHEPSGGELKLLQQPSGEGFIHPVTLDDIRARVAELPAQFTERLQVVQLSRMTRKRALFPCYGMQWGQNVYLYPLEESLVETYTRPPTPQQIVEARMFGAQWSQDGRVWTLTWTLPQLKDFYLNNVLIHEIGHVNDLRNTNSEDRERYANWFAIEYGYRTSRGRR